jgi:hypothetical protein
MLLLGICVKDGVPFRTGSLKPFHIQPLNEILQFKHTTNNFLSLNKGVGIRNSGYSGDELFNVASNATDYQT